jgi:hypothetical protein
MTATFRDGVALLPVGASNLDEASGAPSILTDIWPPRIGVKISPRKQENCGLSSFPKCVAKMQLDPAITVNSFVHICTQALALAH